MPEKGGSQKSSISSTIFRIATSNPSKPLMKAPTKLLLSKTNSVLSHRSRQWDDLRNQGEVLKVEKYTNIMMLTVDCFLTSFVLKRIAL